MEIRNLALERPLDVAIRFAQFTAIKLLGGSVDDDDNLSSSSKSDCEFSSINNSSCTKKKRTLGKYIYFHNFRYLVFGFFFICVRFSSVLKFNYNIQKLKSFG